MRGVFKGGAVVALIAILIAPAVYADDPPAPPDPPQARIRIPIGIAALPPDPPQARIGIPGGFAKPPIVLELLMVWLQGRIGPPTR